MCARRENSLLFAANLLLPCFCLSFKHALFAGMTNWPQFPD